MLVGLLALGAALTIVGVISVMLRALLVVLRQRRAVLMLKRWRLHRRLGREP